MFYFAGNDEWRIAGLWSWGGFSSGDFVEDDFPALPFVIGYKCKNCYFKQKLSASFGRARKSIFCRGFFFFSEKKMHQFKIFLPYVRVHLKQKLTLEFNICINVDKKGQRGSCLFFPFFFFYRDSNVFAVWGFLPKDA
jgi:hypothetical protein